MAQIHDRFHVGDLTCPAGLEEISTPPAPGELYLVTRHAWPLVGLVDTVTGEEAWRTASMLQTPRRP